MEFLIIWLFFAFCSMFVAKNKGRSEGGWFIAGFIFGLFALIVVAILPKIEAKSA